MDAPFADRINDVPRSFLREILKVAVADDVISFAGGLPDRSLFPADAIRAAADRVLTEDAGSALQYGSSEGFGPLREWIAARYRARGVEVDAGDVLVTTGSQQALDLLGKVLVNDGDAVAIEEPGYLGAIQALSLYRPRFHPVPIGANGADPEVLARAIAAARPKLFYTVPNFQNPTGASYDEAHRTAIAEIIAAGRTWLVEDDPYHELRFSGRAKPSFASLVPERTVLVGSFSKIVAPSLRIGWMVAPPPLMEKLVIARQAADLHTGELSQRIVHRYLADNDIDAHIAVIRAAYGARCRAMADALARDFGGLGTFTVPEGGMFLWLTLGGGVSSMALFERAVARGVAFVPGAPFYTGAPAQNTLRLNFSCAGDADIAEGMARLADCLSDCMGELAAGARVTQAL